MLFFFAFTVKNLYLIVLFNEIDKNIYIGQVVLMQVYLSMLN